MQSVIPGASGDAKTAEAVPGSSTGGVSTSSPWVAPVNENGNMTVHTYASKEAFMAAVSKQVAVNGFEPMDNVFSLKEW